MAKHPVSCTMQKQTTGENLVTQTMEQELAEETPAAYKGCCRGCGCGSAGGDRQVVAYGGHQRIEARTNESKG
jgi:hypothetical protein